MTWAFIHCTIEIKRFVSEINYHLFYPARAGQLNKNLLGKFTGKYTKHTLFTALCPFLYSRLQGNTSSSCAKQLNRSQLDKDSLFCFKMFVQYENTQWSAGLRKITLLSVKTFLTIKHSQMDDLAIATLHVVFPPYHMTATSGPKKQGPRKCCEKLIRCL